MTVHLWLAEWSSWGWPLLANHLWQATLISFFACAAIAVLRKAPGRARYVVWMIASVRFVLPSALLVSIAQFLGIDFSLLASHDGSSENATIIFQLAAPINQLDESVSAGAHGARDHSELFCALTIVWLAGSVVLLALWLKRRRRFRLAMRATSVTDTSRERQALERVRSWMQIKGDIRLSMLPGTIEPGVWGVWRPIVFLPECMAEELSEPELEAVMMHEMVHVARWDNLIANLHRLLCCVFWFHPMVWMLDRLLLTERERACDEEVIRLGGAPDVYASSLLKVLRFCLGWNIAGASNATGSNLGRRVEQIVSRNVQLRVSLWHRVALGSIAALVIVLSTAAGLLTREGVGAQTWRPPNRVIGGVPGGIPGGVPGGVPGAVPGGVPDGVPGEIPSGIPGDLPGGDTGFAVVEGQERLIERLDQAPEINVEFKNSAKAPAGITAARVRAVPREIDGPGDEFAVVPVVTLTNNTERRIRGFTLEFRNGLERRAYYERAPYLVAPHGVYTSGSQKRFIILAGRPEGWSVRVGGVVFEDGEVWGVVPPPPPPPPPPVEYEQLDQAPEAAIRFTNREGSPLSITSATVKAARIAGPPRNASDPNSEERYLIKLAVHLVNNTARRISGVAIEYPAAESKDWMRTHASVKIEPHETYKLESPQPEAPGYGALFMRGSPDRMEARVIGVKFEDGEVWGSFPSSPPPPPPPPVLTSGPEDRKLIRKSSGVLVESATLRVVAESPPLARAAKITGSVVVEVTIDEGGVVIASRAISGHPLLKDAAVNAASQWQFKPTTLSGVPVKVIGTLTFHFEP